MKSAYKYLIILALTLLVCNLSEAQKANFETNKGLTIGFGFGAAYQQSDITNSSGGGFDFNLGSYLYKRENALLSVDWRFRFLAGENMAYDHRINTDGSFSNIRYNFFNYDFELGLTLNRLRERTRIVFTAFAGPGITHGITNTDLLDASGSLYDYSVIDPSLGRKQIYTDLVNLTDGNYETKLQSKAALLPTAGIFLGYQFSRSFSMGIEHKINFSLSENNSFTGIDIDNNVVSFSRKDMNHYTSLGFKWILRSGSSGSGRRSNYTPIYNPVTVYTPPANVQPSTNTNPIVTPIPPPLVEIIVPSGTSYSTTEESLEITARVKNVNGKQNIQVVLNNRTIIFDYYPIYGNVKSTINLTEGRNILVITGANQTGSSRDEVTVIYHKPATVVLPQVKFIDPVSGISVEKNSTSITVQTKNVKAWQDVTVSVNGINISNFNFSPDGVVKTNIPLKEGINRVNVSGKNESGSASDVSEITYRIAVKANPPAINILNPNSSPYKTFDQTEEIRALIKGVSVKENITLSVNGIRISGFDYNDNASVLSTLVSLREGLNTVIITARNDAGQDSRTQEIIRETRPCPPPVLRMIEPAQNEIITDNPTITIRTNIRNIESRDQLNVTINNRLINNYNLNGNEITFVAPLISGLNYFIISAENNCGTQKINFSVEYKPKEIILEKPCSMPGINFSISESNINNVSHELKGNISNVLNRENISITINDRPFNEFNFIPVTGKINTVFKFNPGTYNIKVTVKNECGIDSKTNMVLVQQPCTPPQVSFGLTVVSRPDATHELKGSVTNVKNKSDISVTVNNNPFEGFSFVPATGEISSTFKFDPGTYSVKVTVKNECGTDSKISSVSVLQPCTPPQVSFGLTVVSRPDATHELKGSVTNVKNKSDISVTVNNNPFEGFSFVPATGEISSTFKFDPGTYSVKVTVKNECGTNAKSGTVTIEEKPCGVRINPGNSSWEFCMVTSFGTIRRDTLKNSNFQYSGKASSLYFKPIAGGGDAIVIGKPYTLKPGQYYLFTGNLTVTISTKNPGSMGQWSVCIVADKEPVTGIGNNRPKSPCEEQVSAVEKPKKPVGGQNN